MKLFSGVFIKSLIKDTEYRDIAFAVFALIFNLLYSFYNGILGFLGNSVWFSVTFIYYLLLGSMRFFAVLYFKRHNKNTHFHAKIYTGVVLCALSIILAVVLYFSMSQATGGIYGEITMITIALYTFIKIGMAIYKAFKKRNNDDPIFKAIRAIRYAEVSVALLSMQHSMLLSFGSTNNSYSLTLNMITGGAVCIFIMVLGISLIKKGEKNVKIKNNEFQRQNHTNS